MYTTPVFMMHDDFSPLTDTVSFNADIINNKASQFKRDIINIIIIIFINCNWVVIRWQWLFYMYTKYEIGYQ